MGTGESCFHYLLFLSYFLLYSPCIRELARKFIGENQSISTVAFRYFELGNSLSGRACLCTEDDQQPS